MSILEWWEKLGRSRQLGLGLGAAAILGLLVVLSYFIFSEKYVPLLRDREVTDQGSVVAALDAAHTEYRIDAVSGRVLVPESVYEKARVLLQKQGFSSKPQSGFEVFDHSEFGMTDFAEKINYQRALEGEIARTVMGLDGIREARVHLVLPDNSLFRKDKEPPKAVVTVETEQGKTLSSEQIEGIQTLAASAVPGLVAEQVALLDHRGVELTGSAGGGGREGFVQKRMHAKSIAEGYLSEKIYRVLTPLFPGSALTVSVDADISLDHVVSSRDQVLPSKQGGMAVSRLRSAPIKSTPSEVVDEAADGETPKPVVSPSSPAQFDVEYQIGRVHDQIDEYPGEIKRLSVAIVVPAASDIQIQQVKELVIATVGLDPTRGDFISVVPDTLGEAPDHVGPAHVDRTVPILPNPAPINVLSHLEANHWIEWFAGILFVVLLICLLIISRLRRDGAVAKPPLSDAERETLLLQVREWLRQTDAKEEVA